MGLKARIALLLLLMGGALFTGAEALRSLRPAPGEHFPEEIYARFARNADRALYTLRREGEFLAIYPGKRGRDAPVITGIELHGLRRADRAMIEQGLPVGSRQELLQLLEDLGS